MSHYFGDLYIHSYVCIGGYEARKKGEIGVAQKKIAGERLTKEEKRKRKEARET